MKTNQTTTPTHIIPCTRRTLPRRLAGAALALTLLSGLRAPALTLTNFFTPLLSFNGSAAPTNTTDGAVLRLTPSATNRAGSAFVPVTLSSNASFNANFSFRLSNAGGNGGGSGIAFVAQGVGATALGSPAAYIGYGGVSPSLDVEFDTYNNTNTFGSPGDTNGNHVAFNTNGTVNDPISAPITPALNNSNIWFAWIDFIGASNILELRVATSSTRPPAPTLSRTNLNLLNLLGKTNVWVGFTGGTGPGWNDQDVLSWQFTSPQPFLAQTITNFPAIGNHNTTDTVLLTAQASSGLPASFSVASGPAVITGSNTLTFTGPGTVYVAASQPGDSDWLPAPPVTNSFVVKNTQTITFPPIASQVVTNILKLSPTASSGLPVSLAVLSGPAVLSNGTNLAFTAHGWVTVAASQTGDVNNWAATPVTNTFRVNSLYTLTVVSPFGASVPPAGANVIVEGTVLTPQGLPYPIVSDGVVIQYLCMGWTMTGNTPFSGNRSSFVMTLTNNATLTWSFQTNTYFHDDFESGFASWTHTGTWGLDTSSAVSPTHAATDSPGAYYTNNTDSAMTMSSAISLAGMAHPALHFWCKYDLEDGYDFVYAEGSTNGGVSWFQIPGGIYTGMETSWAEQQFDLSTWGTATAFKARFHIVTDSSVVKDGWYVDDVHIGDGPGALTAMPAVTTANSVTLNWTASNIGDFAAYRVYRSMTPGQPWTDGLLVGTITGQDTTMFVDTTVAPKTHYYYQIVVVNVAQLFAFSGVIPAVTAIGMDYPFLDNGEAGGGTWVADPPWALSTEDAVSPTHSWSDSPGGNYTNNIAGQSLTLSSPMSFLTAVNPVLTFWHKYALGSGDYVNVEASTNAGAGWALLGSYSGSSAGWIRGRYSLANYAGQAGMLVRFRLTSDSSGTGDGWHIDDISVTEGLATVSPVTLDQVAANSMRLTWPTNTQGAFSYYAIFRDTNAAVGINSPLAGIVTNQNTPMFTVTGLSPNSTCYFRVYAVNSYGGYSLDATVPASTNTTLLTTPFADNFEEASPFNFSLTGNWGLTALTSHSGLQCLTDSPGTNYSPNADDWALMQLNLSQNQWPVLRFWDRYSIGGSGRGALDVNGSTSMYIVSGTRVSWQPQTVDLSWWAGQPNVPVKFRLNRWSGEQADGWYIDDVSVTEQTPVTLSFPFYDGFENGLTNWLPGTWHVVTDTPYDGTNTVYNQFTDSANVNAQQPMLSLAGWLNLTNTVNPQLVFWYRSSYSYNDLHAQIYAPGSGWATVWNDPNWGTGYGWTRAQVSLGSYVNQKIRLNFYSTGNRGFWVDKVAIANQPAPVTITSATAQFKSVQLNWTPTTSSAGFKWYEVWRGTSAGNEGWLATLPSLTQTNFTDTNGLSATTAYYYRVYAVDTNDIYTASVNETNATTTVLPYPFADDMSTLNQWITSGQWGLATNTAHSGSSCLSDSPNGNYTANADDNAQTSLDLRLAQWPVLKFWDKYALSGNARAAVDVNGISMYIVTGTQTAWQPEAIDLSWWAGQASVPLKFRLNRWNGEQADGWYIDDVSVTEQTPVTLSFPFYDGFENGPTNWLPGTWHLATDGPYDGTNSMFNLVTDSANVNAQQPMLSLAGWVNLTNAVNPQLVFWYRSSYSYNDLHAQIYVPGTGWIAAWTDPHWGTGYGWSRAQVSLASYVNQKIRLNFYGTGSRGFWVDKVAIANQPAPVTITSATAQFKSVQLNWTPTVSSAGFKWYEVWRGTSAGNEGWLATLPSLTQTNFTDTNGLSATTAYYYRVYAVDTNDIYTASVNETNATTTVLPYPFADDMSTLNQWITSGQWGLATNTAHSGSSCLSDSPNGNYAANADDNAQTSLDLRLAQWPVLKFWDKYTVSGNARAAVDVNGISMYIVNGTQTAWQQEVIDLSWWVGQASVPLKFRLNRWNNEQADGWYIDDVSVAEQTPVTLSFPFYDGFENGPTNWLPGTWHLATDSPYDGTNSMYNLVTDSANVHAQQPMLSLAGWVNLTNSVNPQLVFWYRSSYSYNDLHAQIYVPGTGWVAAWTDPHWGTGYGWSRAQVSLTSYVNQKIRLNFYGAGDRGFWVDKVAIANQPAPVTITSATAQFKSVQLNWTPTTSTAGFKWYEVWRGTSSGNEGWLATLPSLTQTNFTDTNSLSATTTYYYRVYAVNTNDIYTASVNETNATTTVLPYPFADDMSTLNQWIASGQWGLTTNTAHSGPSCLTDSPNGNYTANADDNAQTSLDLRLAQWPVLKFWDKYTVSGNARAAVDVNGISMYIVNGTQTAWQQEVIDLSWWVGQASVPLKFRLNRWNGEQADGWYIDDVSVTEQTPVTLTYPFYDSFETGPGNWLPGTWHLATDSPYDGTNSMYNLITDSANVNAQQPMLSLAGWVNLTNAVNPRLVFWYRSSYSYNDLHAQIYVPGTGWVAVWNDPNWGTGYGWTRAEVSLASYVNRLIRINFYSTGNRAFWVDKVGVGGIMPGAPARAYPPEASLVTALRPTLTVTNAIHAENFPLTYQFEVYSDANLSNLVAQVPLVSSGVGLTSWPLDINLGDNARYWWRCRAWSSTNAGPWMPTATFYVNSVGLPPLAVVLASPVGGSVIQNTNTFFSWYAGVDPAGDFIQSYNFQVDSDSAFGSPEVGGTLAMSGPVDPLSNVTISVPLGGYAGAQNLQPGVHYYWRVRAQDAHGMVGPWSSDSWYFVLSGTTTPVRATITAFQRANGTNWLIRWTGPTNNVYLEGASALSSAPAWSSLAGPLSGTSYTFQSPTNWSRGFYRLRSQ